MSKFASDGMVKVLDFGLAKALASSTAGFNVGRTAVMDSPTLTSPAMTRTGVILGTAAYMSPEQARGKPADRQDRRLKKIPAGGGTAIDYGPGHQGGSFGPDGTLIFNTGHGEGLVRVRAGSTTPEVLTTVNRPEGEAGHHWPHILPDSKHALYTAEMDGKPYSEARWC